MDVLGRSKEDRMIRRYSHYQGYKWGCILVVAGILVNQALSNSRLIGDRHSLVMGVAMVLFTVMAIVFHEKMQHVQTITKYRKRLADKLEKGE